MDERPRFAHASKVGIDICKALGLDPSTVRSLTMTLEPNMGAATVTVEHLVTTDNSLETTLRRYRVVEVEQ